MAIYIDTSILVAILKNEAAQKQALDIWQSYPQRLSSILLQTECLVVLNRSASTLAKKISKKWLAERLQLLDLFLEEIDLRILDHKINEIIQYKLTNCDSRSLDTIHLATALHYQSKDPELVFASFDKNLNKHAKVLGLKTID